MVVTWWIVALVRCVMARCDCSKVNNTRHSHLVVSLAVCAVALSQTASN